MIDFASTFHCYQLSYTYVQTGSGVHPACSTVGPGIFPGDKAAGM